MRDLRDDLKWSNPTPIAKEWLERAIVAERDNKIYLKIIDEQKDTIVGCNRVYKELQDQNAALREKTDLQRHSIQQLSAQVVGLREILVKTLPIIGELAESIGYGYYKPVDPRDFTPDFECCSKTEISNWKNDCVKAESGEEIGDIRLWGLGTYKIKDPEMIELREKMKTILTQPDPGAKIRERMRKLEAAAEAAKEVFRQIDLRTHAIGLGMSNYHAITIRVKQGDSEYWQALWEYNKAQALAELTGDVPCP